MNEGKDDGLADDKNLSDFNIPASTPGMSDADSPGASLLNLSDASSGLHQNGNSVAFKSGFATIFAIAGTFSLSLLNASQMSQFIIETGNFEESLNNNIPYYLCMWIPLPFLIGFSGIKFNMGYNKKIFNSNENIFNLFKKYPAETAIIFFTLVTQFFVLMGCIEDFFPQRASDTTKLSIALILSAFGSFQYILCQGRELIKRMSKKSECHNSFFKGYWLLKNWKERCLYLTSYIIPLFTILGGYFTLAYVQATKIIKKYASHDEKEAADWGMLIAVPLALIYTAMYFSLYGYQAQAELKSIFLKEASFKNFLEEIKKNPPIMYFILCFIGALSEGIVLAISIKELFGKDSNAGTAFAVTFFILGAVQNFLVEGLDVLKRKLGKERNSIAHSGESSYDPDKFYGDTLQVATLLFARLMIAAWLLPDTVKNSDYTSNMILFSYFFSSIASLLSTYVFSEIPTLISWIKKKNEDKNSNQQEENFIISKGRCCMQGVMQLIIPIGIGYLFEKIFYLYFKKHTDAEMALNYAQIIGSISTGLTTVFLRKIIDYFFRQYHKQPENIAWCPRLFRCAKSIGRSISGEEENKSEEENEFTATLEANTYTMGA